jgi:hypothetical protein
MRERLNVSDFDGKELEEVRKGQLAEVVKNHPPQPQQPYGQPQEVPNPKVPEHMKRHITRSGRG